MQHRALGVVRRVNGHVSPECCCPCCDSVVTVALPHVGWGLRIWIDEDAVSWLVFVVFVNHGRQLA